MHILLLILLAIPNYLQAAGWPDLSTPPQAIGGGEKDAAVIVGLEKYAFVEDIPGARQNAEDWHAYLTETLKIPAHRVSLLRNEEGTLELMRKSAIEKAAEVEAGGTLWFVFIGHGAPSKDGKDGLLVGVDAQQRADSLFARSFSTNELLGILSRGKQAKTVVLVDACFSGRTSSGQALVKGLQPLVVMARTPGAFDNRTILITAAKSDQFAGPLPRSAKARPAFSYLALGGLRGWAADAKGKITASGLVDFVMKALKLAKDRTQTPELAAGAGTTVLGMGWEPSPNLARIDRHGRARTIQFKTSALPELTKANAPSAAGISNVPRAQMPGDLKNIGGIDFGSLDIDALEKYDAVVKFEKSDASAEEKSARWRELGRKVKTYADLAQKRTAAWDDYAAPIAFNAVVEKDKSDLSPVKKALAWRRLADKYPRYDKVAKDRVLGWKRFARELAAAEKARAQRIEMRDKDWAKLKRLLALSVVGETDKQEFASTFVKAYGKDPEGNPYIEELLPLLPREMPSAEAMVPYVYTTDIQWADIPGGAFMMGSEKGKGDEKPAHRVTIRAFQMAKTEVTIGQYQACVDAGKCNKPHPGGSCWNAPPRPKDHPVNCVSWGAARAFSAWVGGRLPSEAEWEYAARSGGKDREYPWGDEKPSCDRVVMRDKDYDYGCGRESTWPVCSKLWGNTDQGLCDMLGNISEWVQDLNHGSYKGAPTDGSAWETPDVSIEEYSRKYRIKRGGDNASSNSLGLGAMLRDAYHPTGPTQWTGFRPVRDVP